MKKTIKDLFKLITAIATVAGILYVARDQIKAIIAKIKEVSDDDFDDDFDDESFDDDSFDDDSFDDDEIFPEPSKTTEIMFLSTSQILMMMIHP